MHITSIERAAQSDIRTRCDEILSRLRISDVWRALGGGELRHGRGRAWWRDGDGYSVALSDERACWYDHRDGIGGGILDLVEHVRGCSRADALRWCADLAGVALDDTPLSREDRERWAAERRELERDLPAARYWRETAIGLSEELLCALKAALIDPMLPQPAIGELQDITAMLSRLRRLDGAALVAEYRSWLADYPGMTAAMVASAQRMERARLRALKAYLRQMDVGSVAA